MPKTDFSFNFDVSSRLFANREKLSLNARELHTQLKVGKFFANWIKGRIEQCNFIENQDFIIDLPNLANQTKGRGGDRRSLDYWITIDMAKHLAMLEKNEIGHQARQYFVDCEDTLQKAVNSQNQQSFNIEPEKSIENQSF